METIRVAEDFEGLRIAALELLEESFEAPETERLRRFAEIAANGAEMLAKLPQRRTLSPGYYIWLAAIQESVVEPMEAGIAFGERDLLADEALALLAIRRARSDFNEAHPPCRGCGKPMRDAQASHCDGCEQARWKAEVMARR